MSTDKPQDYAMGEVGSAAYGMTDGAEDTAVIPVPTPSGTLNVRVVEVKGQPLLVLTGDRIAEEPLVRFHSSCVFGEALHADDCDCGAQLNAAVAEVIRDGGIVIYAWEEGRGAGIVAKVKAIALEKKHGISTAEAYVQLGLVPEPRDFSNHVAALRTVFHGRKIRLVSNNPGKIAAAEAAGLEVERVTQDIVMTPARQNYIASKRQHLGHLSDD